MKTFNGIVVSIKMKDTVIVEITRYVAHPLYKKLMKRSKRFKVAPAGVAVALGDTVTITQTRPVSKEKFFKIAAIVSKKIVRGKKQEVAK